MATRSLIQDALHHLHNGSPEAAIAQLEDAIERTPAHAAAYVLLARAYESQQQWTKARKAWDRAFVLMPHSPAIQQGRTRVRHALKKANDPDHPSPPAVPPPDPIPAPSPSDGPDTSPTTVSTDSPNESTEMPPTDEFQLPNMDMDEGPSDLDSLRAQTEQVAREQQPATSSLAEDIAAEADAPLSEDTDDLDRLIQELEAARITPDPEIDEIPPPDLDDDVDDMVSETLARIYASQGKYNEAARVYVELARMHPDRKDTFLKQASKMRTKAREDAT